MAGRNYDYRNADHLLTRFSEADDGVSLTMLHGIRCGRSDTEQGPHRTGGLVVLDTPKGRFENNRLRLEAKSFEASRVQLSWLTDGETLRVDSTWQFFAEAGICRRQDVVTNTGDEPVTLLRAHSRFTLAPAAYELYTQESRSCGENQGRWQQLTHGCLTLKSEGGRSVQGATPYLALREVGGHTGIAMHLLPVGNWTIHAHAHTGGAGRPWFLTVELGLADERLRLELAAGESIKLPELLIQSVPQGQPHLAAPLLHRHVQERQFVGHRAEAPVAYNTWFDTFDQFDVDRLKQQVAAARQLGCEVFVVDAGWFGQGATNWWVQIGDWRENPAAAFHGRMDAFADHVRAAGLGFGLWMEPERLGPAAPILQQHPDWFIKADNQFHWPDITQPQVYEYIRAEMARLIEKYQLAWMKVDFNFDRGTDVTGSEFFRYYQRWYALLDELRAAYPNVFFEGCASGGLRLDLAMLDHCDGHFLSDNVNPTDVIRISEGAMLRVPPGRITKWVVVRAATPTPNLASSPAGPWSPHLITPDMGHWGQWGAVRMDYDVMSAMPGMMALSGDIAGLLPADQQQLAAYVAFFKQWRTFIVRAVAHLLTIPGTTDSDNGYAAVQLQSLDQTRSLVFVYRMANTEADFRLPLRQLDAQQTYNVRQGLSDAPAVKVSGLDLMHQGLSGQLPAPFSAGVWVVEPLG
jgi:alpha-galactosidase